MKDQQLMLANLALFIDDSRFSALKEIVREERQIPCCARDNDGDGDCRVHKNGIKTKKRVGFRVYFDGLEFQAYDLESVIRSVNSYITKDEPRPKKPPTRPMKPTCLCSTGVTTWCPQHG